MPVFAVVWLENNFVCLCKGERCKTKRRPFPSHHSRTSIIWLTTSGTPSGSIGFIALKIQACENIPCFRVTLFTASFRAVFRSLEGWNSTFRRRWMLLFLSLVRGPSTVERKGGGKGREKWKGRRVHIWRETPDLRNFTDIHSVSSRVSFKGCYWDPEALAIHRGIYMQRCPLGAKV